jgi:alpha-N-arabinofuranosidase
VELKGNNYSLFVEQVNKSAPKIVVHLKTPKNSFDKNITIGIEGDAGKINFYYINKTGKRVNVLNNADAKILSTEVAGGFVGTYLGMHTRTE